MFDWIIGNVGELRTDIITWVVYRFNGTTWIVNKSGTPSSAAFPTAWNTVWDVREDILTWFEYRWNGSAWVLITKAGDTDEDWVPDTVEDWGITAAKLATDAVETDKIKNWAITQQKTTITFYTVEILAWETVWTVTVPYFTNQLGIFPNYQDQIIRRVAIDDTTLTVTLNAPATANNYIRVSTITAPPM